MGEGNVLGASAEDEDVGAVVERHVNKGSILSVACLLSLLRSSAPDRRLTGNLPCVTRLKSQEAITEVAHNALSELDVTMRFSSLKIRDFTLTQKIGLHYLW